MREKITTRTDEEFIPFSAEQKKILREKRARALRFLEALQQYGIFAYVYGSVVRGDVTKTSDIDIIVPISVPSLKIELALAPFHCFSRTITQATPNHTLSLIHI